MRPLNNHEGSHKRVWKVLPKYSSVAQTTREGKPLSEKITGRNFFTFDKTFGEDVNTKKVYESCAKGIVDSVVSGLNGTIFAYGQTSSGKTYTMQGSGTIAQGSAGQAGGIVHMAASDIFEHIQAHPERMFLVRASFLEIYNEEVRDLLSTEQKVLQIREDPRRGVFVQSHEEYVTNYESLLQVLFTGEKSRAFASTAMNERSSRSHTIFRITIESREKSDKQEQDQDSENEDANRPDGAVRVSTLNLVDLAGSESVRHTGATGDRQKEGGMINQSLRTLSRVIVALGQPNQSHINFRDSKLTRILQPSLSGNARMAVICCATPSELYLEETRSTLLFASRAKLVKTNAQVNEVLDDRSMIRRLQKELAQARAEAGGAPSAKVEELEKKAAHAGYAAKEAHEKLRKLQESILNNEGLFAKTDHAEDTDVAQRKRRRSDGAIHLKTAEEPMSSGSTPKTLPRPEKKTRLLEAVSVSGTEELELLREALLVKSRQLNHYQTEIRDIQQQVEEKETILAEMNHKNESLESECDQANSAVAEFQTQLSDLRDELAKKEKAYKGILDEKERTYQDILTKLEQELNDRKVLEETVDSLQEDKGKMEAQLSERLQEVESNLHQVTDEKNTLVQEKANKETEIQSLQEQIEKLTAEVEDCRQINKTLETELTESKQKCECQEADILSLQQHLTAEKQIHEDSEEHAREQIQAAKDELAQFRQQSEEETNRIQIEKSALEAALSSLTTKTENLEAVNERLTKELEEATLCHDTVREEKDMLEARLETLREDAGTSETSYTVLLATVFVRMDNLQKNATATESVLKEQVSSTKEILAKNTHGIGRGHESSFRIRPAEQISRNRTIAAAGRDAKGLGRVADQHEALCRIRQ